MTERATRLSRSDKRELQAITSPAQLDGVLWEDHVRVARLNGRYVVKKSTTGRILARFSTIEAALDEAQRRNQGKWR